MRKKTWTPEENKIMEDQLIYEGVTNMAKILNRSKYSVRDRGRAMGLLMPGKRTTNGRKAKIEEMLEERTVMVDELKYFINFTFKTDQNKVRIGCERVDDAVQAYDLSWWYRRRNCTLGQLCELFVDGYSWIVVKDVLRKKIIDLKEGLMTGGFEDHTFAYDLYFGDGE